MRVLALVPGGIGDQLLFFPTLDDLKRAYPDAQIDIVVEPRAKDAYRVCKSVHDIIPFDFKQNNSLADWGNLLGIIRDREYDIALSLGQRWAIGLLLWLTGIPTRVGYAAGGARFLTNPVPLKQEQYAAQMYHDLLQGLNISGASSEITINVPKKDIEWAEAEQKRLGIQESGYVLIHGGSSKLSKAKGIDKIYPVQNWQKIIQDFRKRQPNLPIVVVQGPDDAEFVTELQAAASDVKVTKPSDIGKLAAMIAAANLMLCTDSAPMHLAVAVKTFTLALFGPTNPDKLLPQTNGSRETRFVGIKSPTGKMADITPETVLKKVWGS
ncbi:glycosyltransferase family 9 protein [Trichocoleus sp. FACHB-591]|uniref:glycosyltransferase family 9 protein n=1 Tax=Trichocoleus sp. FACHB-591 TaxID=2692872 RepID=UPI001689F1F2|nr:glycosyltransferase family 9 protein [Trichocoleus sp. FACHB-591]MBD2097639.1 glycosyltransferase family 9 protein [Trichocoleus sp. FACHB-591]